MQNSTPQSSVNPLPSFGNILMQKKSLDIANKQLESYSRVIEKLDTLANQISIDTKSRNKMSSGTIKSAVKDKIADVKQGFNFDSILRKVLNPSFGSITARVIDNLEEKRLNKSAKKIEKSEFKNNFFDNTMLGKTVDRNSKKGKNLLEDEFKKFEMLNAQKVKLESSISAKSDLKSKFGIGGPTKKDMAAFTEINKLIEANTIRIEKGEAAANNFLKMKPKGEKEKNNSGSKASDTENQKEALIVSNGILTTLKQIEENTRKKDAPEAEKKHQEAIKPPSWFETALGFLKTALLAAGGALMNVVKSLGNIVGKVFNSIKSIASSIGIKVKDLVLKSAKAATNVAAKATQAVKNAIKVGGTKVLDVGKKVFGAGADKAKIVASNTMNAAKSIMAKGSSAMSTAVKAVKSGLSSPVAKGLVKAGSKAAGFLGKALPGVGAGLSVYDAAQRYKRGDYLGAGIAGLAGATSFVPGLGTLATLGLTGVNVARDYMASKPSNKSGEAVVSKSTDIEIAKLAALKPNTTQQNSIVAPTYNNSNTSIHQKASVRNTEASFNRYLKA